MTSPVIVNQTNQPFPKLDAPFVNPDGTVALPWYKFLQALWNRTGGAQGIISTDIVDLTLSNSYSVAGLLGRVANLEASAFPIGAIVLWPFAAAALPPGWVVCNGLGGTIDLRDVFVIGAGFTYPVGATGGAAQVTLAPANIPPHTHPHGATPTATLVGGTTAAGLLASDTGVNQPGPATPFSILPPFYALLFIQKVQ